MNKLETVSGKKNKQKKALAWKIRNTSNTWKMSAIDYEKPREATRKTVPWIPRAFGTADARLDRMMDMEVKGRAGGSGILGTGPRLMLG